MTVLRAIVVTIHGASPDRRWQETVRSAFAPHFSYHALSYPQYDGPLGFPKLFCGNGGWLFSLLFGGSYVLCWFFGPSFIQSLWLISAALVLCGILAFWLERRRRNASRDEIVRQLRQITGTPFDEIHVVAHSFGTYLTVEILRKELDIHIDHLILLGSVLPEDLRWGDIAYAHATDGAPIVRRVRNEMGLKDIIVDFSGRFRWLIGGVGSAGRDGFRETPNDSRVAIHTIAKPLDPCVQCKTPSPADVLVHNVPLGAYEHSDWFQSPDHARILWIPTLWGLNPAEYSRFAVLCSAATRGNQEAFAELRWSRWSWTRFDGTTLTLHDYLVIRLIKRDVPPERVEAVAEIAARWLCLHFCRAFTSGVENEPEGRLSFPVYAIEVALSEVGSAR